MIKIFGQTDRIFTTNGDIVVSPFKAKVHKKDNGDYYLEIETPLDYCDYFVQGNIIVANTPSGDQAFRIDNILKTKSRITCKCWHVFYDTKNYLIADSYVVNKNCYEALVHLNNALEPQSEFSVTSDISTVASYRCVRKSFYEAIQDVIGRWGGHLVRNDFGIGIKAEIGEDRGITVQYKKNLKEITCEENWDSVVTKILPVGKDGILLNELDPSADIYITSSTQYDLPYTKTVSFNQNIDKDDYPDEQSYMQALVNDLRSQATAYLAQNCVPKVNYKLKANLERVTDIGDTIEVIDERFSINMLTHVIGYTYDCIAEKYTELEFGSFMQSLSNLVSSVTTIAKDEAVAEAIQEVSGSFLSDFPTFTEASTRENIYSGEKFSNILGKIKKFFSDLKTVAFSGSYNDLTDQPTIPAAQVNSDWNATSGVAEILNKPTKLSDFINDSGFITNTVSNLTNYYLKSETYTQAEVNSLIAGITGLHIEVVQTLPTTDISTTTIYLVPKTTAGTQDVYDEYINLDGTTSGWEHIGSTEVDLTNYYTKTETDNLLAAKVSDNPTFTEASTRANIASGESFATILGKIKKFFSDLKTVAFSGSYNDLTDQPTIPTVNNATLTIQKNGTNVQTFTANASANKTANITVPTKMSDLTNDVGMGIYYGECTTAADVAAKTVTISADQNFTLKVGAIVAVKFSYTNSASNPTLEVNSTGAKSIFRGTAVQTSGNAAGAANYIYYYLYNGTYWCFISWGIDNNTTYSNRAEASGGTAVSLCTTGEKYTWNHKLDDNPTFTEASTRANIASGESFATILGKIQKYFSDLKDLAYIAKDGTSSAKYLRGDGTWQAFSKSTVGLGNVDNTADNNKPVPVVECSTARNVLAKDVALNGFTLKTGSRVYVRFTDTGTANPSSGNFTLNVNNTGAKTIVDGKSNKTVMSYSYGGWLCNNYFNEFVYDGTYWVWTSRDNNTTYSNRAAASGGTQTSLCTTGEKYTWNNKLDDNPTFTEASTRANIASGESLATILGKIKKFFSDLKTVAFSGSYNDLTDQPTIPQGTVTSVATGAGLTGGTITGSGTIKADLKSETKSSLEAASMGSTSSRQYAVGLDKNGDLSVNVPWTDTKVTQTATSTSADYEVLFSVTADNTTRTEGARKNDNLKFNPSTGEIAPTGYRRIDITGNTLDLDTLNLSAGAPNIVYYIEKTDGGAANITNRPVTANKPFILDVELIRWASTSDYITRQTYRNAANSAYEYVRFCTNGTWGAWTTRKFTDTTYSAMTAAELVAGTATNLRTERADYLRSGIDQIIGESYFVLANKSLNFSNLIATVSDTRITANTFAEVYFTDATLQAASNAGIVVDTSAGTITFTATSAPSTTLVCYIVCRK